VEYTSFSLLFFGLRTGLLLVYLIHWSILYFVMVVCSIFSLFDCATKLQHFFEEVDFYLEFLDKEYDVKDCSLTRLMICA
jgi:hypothetical protein